MPKLACLPTQQRIPEVMCFLCRAVVIVVRRLRRLSTSGSFFRTLLRDLW